MINTKMLSGRTMRHVASLVCLLMLTTTLAGCTSENFSSTNECWKKIYETLDSPPGGVIDSNMTYHYDEARNLILEEELLWNGGIGERTAYTYDSMSNLVESYRTWDGEFQKITYTYDNDGNEITKSTQNSYTWDDDVTEITTYDSSGNSFTVEYDDLSDGSIDRRLTYIRNDDGLLLEMHRDEDGDGDYDERVIYRHNSEQQNTRTDTYDDSNSITGYTVHTYHSGGGHLTTKTDWDNDGRYDLIFTVTYDELDRIVSTTMIFDSELEILGSTYISSYEYVGDTSDISLVVSNRYDGAGDLDEVSTTYYGCID